MTFVFGLSESEDIKIQIFNYAGKLVKTVDFSGSAGNRNRATVDTSALSNGVYYYLIRSKQVTFKMSKFIIAR